MTVINTNVSALVAQNAMTVNSRAQSAAMQQLSTGLRINGAKDDAAGLAIASKMTSQVRGLDQSVRNANDGISMLQTADGAMVEVTNMLQRMRELAVQSATDTNTSDDRTALNNEFGQLKSQINQIVANTQWNGMNLLDATGGSSGTFKFQVGANANQTISKTINSMGYASSSGTATTLLTLSGVGAAAHNVATTTISTTGTWALGDVISINVGNSQLQYTVAANDLTGADNTANAALIAGHIASASDSVSFAGSGVLATAVATTNAVAFTGSSGVGFNASSSASNGSLATIAALDVTLQGNANTAITGITTALKTVNTERADLGAVVNRLTYAADNLSNVSQNTSASRSRILDTDYAKASSELARTQIIAQASTAMLAQANQSQQSVLALLK